MTRARAVSLLAMLALSATSCRACFGGETVATDTGPPRAKVVYKLDQAYGGKLPGAVARGYLRIETSPPHEFRICDTKPLSGAVVVQPGGKRVAARCNEGPWSVVELGGGGRAFLFCKLEKDPSKDWQAAPSVEKNATDVLRCTEGPVFKDLVAELRARETDDRALADFFFDAAALHYNWNRGTEDWVHAYTQLSSAARKLLDTKLCDGLMKQELNSLAANLAARVCDLDDDRYVEPLRAYIEKVGEDRGSAPSLWQWGILRILRARPKEVGAAVCQQIGLGEDWNADPFPLMVAGFLKQSCPRANRRKATLCGSAILCGGATCTGDETRKRIEKAFDSALARKLPREAIAGLDVTPAHVELAFRYAQGPLDTTLIQKECDAGE